MLKKHSYISLTYGLHGEGKDSIIFFMKYAYDCHLHLLPLSHVCLSAYLDYSFHNPVSETYAQLTAHDYVMRGILQRQGNVQSLVAVMEHDASNQISIYENDLKGLYDKNANSLLSEKGLEININGKDISYDKLVLCSQIMDFNLKGSDKLAYPLPEHDIVKQANEILEGIEKYHKNNPNSKVEVLPFFGINPLNYDEDKIQEILENCFDDNKLKIGNLRFGKTVRKFVGIKVYPPMGFDPYPSDAKLRAKNEVLFSFCEKNAIPIVTHCDDQGFRMVQLENSFDYTSPERWLKVLKEHPNLYLDFAHFGTQYYHATPIQQLASHIYHEVSWRKLILNAMKEYPHVYADLSFGGVDSDMWKEVQEIVTKATDSEKEIYSKRLLFGTDWPLSLSKIESALEYWLGFEKGFKDEKLVDKILSSNAEDFLHWQ